jgi:hypothetical protein
MNIRFNLSNVIQLYIKIVLPSFFSSESNIIIYNYRVTLIANTKKWRMSKKTAF